MPVRRVTAPIGQGILALAIVGLVVVVFGGKLLVDRVPEYYIEKLPAIAMSGSNLAIGTQDQPPKVHYYRVTAKGYGVSQNTEVVLQSTYFSWNGN